MGRLARGRVQIVGRVIRAVGAVREAPALGIDVREGGHDGRGAGAGKASSGATSRISPTSSAKPVVGEALDGDHRFQVRGIGHALEELDGREAAGHQAIAGLQATRETFSAQPPRCASRYWRTRKRSATLPALRRSSALAPLKSGPALACGSTHRPPRWKAAGSEAPCRCRRRKTGARAHRATARRLPLAPGGERGAGAQAEEGELVGVVELPGFGDAEEGAQGGGGGGGAANVDTREGLLEGGGLHGLSKGWNDRGICPQLYHLANPRSMLDAFWRWQPPPLGFAPQIEGNPAGRRERPVLAVLGESPASESDRRRGPLSYLESLVTHSSWDIESSRSPDSLLHALGRVCGESGPMTSFTWLAA